MVFVVFFEYFVKPLDVLIVQLKQVNRLLHTLVGARQFVAHVRLHIQERDGEGGGRG
jgi:hypothetical protein